jgi:hypothetical protein
MNEANNVVIGTLLVCSHDAKVLFDSGATHSFVSCKFLNNHGIESDLLRKRLCRITYGWNDSKKNMP